MRICDTGLTRVTVVEPLKVLSQKFVEKFSPPRRVRQPTDAGFFHTPAAVG